MAIKPLVLVIMDGWGLSAEPEGNAILSTPTPNLDRLIGSFPYASLHASGEEVGLEWGEMGNSEVGHLNLGTGRVVLQDFTRINQVIDQGLFLNNQALIETFDWATAKNSNLHLVGLFSAGGVHSHMEHLFALLRMAKIKQFNRVIIHLVTDGRDSAPKIILKDLKKLNDVIKEVGFGQIASIMGRYWAMDRDKHFDRTQKAYDCMTNGSNLQAASVETAVDEAYKFNQTDEFITPVAIRGVPRIKPGDAVICFNFRADRTRQIAEKMIERGDIFFTSFTSYGYEPTSLVKVAFFTPKIENQLAQVLEKNKVTQLHIAETTKYAHVTYFFNGGWEQPFNNEARILVPSAQVATFDLKPEMSAAEITSRFIEYFKTKKPGFTVMNLANADMVGHTGDFAATQKAVKVVDECVGKIAAEVLHSQADLIVTADHGNAEQMINPQTKEIDKEHTTNPVPLILAFLDKQHQEMLPSQETKIAWAIQPPVGVLADVTATIINRMGLKPPEEITGQSLTEAL